MAKRFKLPNFRLHETQATAGMLASIMGLFCLLVLGVTVFKNFDTKQWVIPYNEEAGLSQYRKPVVFALTPVAMLLGGVGGILGFSSLGQPRNNRQDRSWVGMTLGAIVIPIAIVFCLTWIRLSEPVIVPKKADASSASAVDRSPPYERDVSCGPGSLIC